MNRQISDAELDVMKIVWAQGGPVHFKQIMEGLAAQGKPWQKNTVITLLARLMEKGFLRAQKTGRRNAYTPLVAEADYRADQTRSFLDKVFAGSAGGLVTQLIKADWLTPEEYAELRALLEEGEES